LLSVVLMHLQSRIAGDIAGPSGGQGSSAHPEKPLIKEDNALATLQAAFPKEVKYKTIKGLHHSRSAQLRLLHHFPWTHKQMRRQRDVPSGVLSNGGQILLISLQ